ncbi:MAG: hypothetical protein JXQ80_01135 [Bacteroidales bacterium]|nr:hypothetical protein [Bacteroidales bacterium]
MKPASTVTNPVASKFDVVKKTMRKILRWITFLVILFLVVFIYWKYFYTYSEGYRAGLLQKFSRKGTIFKTYEGELILSSVSGRKDIVIASEKFLFSVTNKSLAAKLDTLQGLDVIVHYHQKNGALPWKGDTPYLVDSVKAR